MPVAVGTERKQLFAYDRIIKTRAWTSLLIVNPKGDAEVNGLLAFCPRLKMTVVWDPDRVTPLAPPTEPLRRAAVLARLQVTERANPRLRVLADQPPVVAAQLASEQHDGELELFSGAILVQLDQDKPLAPQLRCWAALCAPDGMLIGKQHADLKLRAELTRVSPLWRPWPNGLWLLDVVCFNPRPPRGGDDEYVTRETGPIKPPVGALETQPVVSNTATEHPMNLARTRPVWETLERNLAS